MSHISLAQTGLAAVEARRWDEAVTKLSAALKVSTNPTWLVGRSKALVGLSRFQEALDDANLAWHTAFQRNNRAVLAEAHYRRAVAYFRLGEYANADYCCILAMRLIKGFPAVEKDDPARKWADDKGFWTATREDAMDEAKHDKMNAGSSAMNAINGMKSSPQATAWRMASTLRVQVLGIMDKLAEDDASKKLTTSIRPQEKQLSDVKSEKETAKPAASSTTTTTTTAAVKPQVPSDAPLRLQEFQSNTTMSVSIFSKGTDKAKLQVEFLPSAVRLDPIVYPNGDEKAFRLDLWGEIDPAASKYTVTPNKVELSLAKKTAGKWPTLKADVSSSEGAPHTSSGLDAKEAEEKPKAVVSEATTTTAPPATITTSTTTTATAAETNTKTPAYPTSSRSGPKNWDQVGEEENSDEERDANYFFKKLYKNATPEQQRAMMKSFTESNGTSLSTDWNDVKDRTVKTVPPDGVEAKKWD